MRPYLVTGEAGDKIIEINKKRMHKDFPFPSELDQKSLAEEYFKSREASHFRVGSFVSPTVLDRQQTLFCSFVYFKNVSFLADPVT